MKQIQKTLYVSSNYYFHCQGECLVCEEKDNKVRVPFCSIEKIIVFGNPIISSALIRELSSHNISISFVSEYGGFNGSFQGPSIGNVVLRKNQYFLDGTEREINLVKNILLGKIQNQRKVLIKRAKDSISEIAKNLIQTSNNLTYCINQILNSNGIDSIRGWEGKAGQIYFDSFDYMLKTSNPKMMFLTRSKHPAKNNVNALLDLFYTILSLDCVSALETFGLDSYFGYLHELRPGRHSLACDLMEEFRALIVDDFIITLINRGQVKESDFDNITGKIRLKDTSRKNLLKLWEEHKRQEIYFRLYKVKTTLLGSIYYQAQLMAQYIRQDIEEYPPFVL